MGHTIKEPFAHINALVANEGFAFQAWDDRYCKGVWAALGPYENAVDVVRDLSSAGDLDMMPAMDYVLGADWMPIVTGKTLTEAMATLEARLACLPDDQLHRGSDWAAAVQKALENLRQTYDECSDYGDLEGKLSPLPKTFDGFLARSHIEVREGG
ncbi:hypothetical protein [Ensifer sp. LCM 4579]|uniref:hypothetical protein n=1 Tax=Ensifer sp. LCM 4579 TaxID=1848292 RepID=UPI0008D97138|nr:hypothetical protein [Ensifer sp. LCM 4579]OHV80381.1 hypothetical protein LCM4579_22615 [Ensifer sp. LCM 4579]